TEGGGWLVKTSAEALAKEKGYVTLEESIGFKIEHFPPPFVERGTPREPSSLRDTDWNFSKLLSGPDDEKRLPLFHELARESSRMREACRVYEAGRHEAAEWQRKEAEATTPLEQAHIAIQAGNSETMQARKAAEA